MPRLYQLLISLRSSNSNKLKSREQKWKDTHFLYAEIPQNVIYLWLSNKYNYYSPNL